MADSLNNSLELKESSTTVSYGNTIYTYHKAIGAVSIASIAIGTIGTIGNLISFYIFFRLSSGKSSINVLLAFLSFSDAVACAAIACYEIMYLIHGHGNFEFPAALDTIMIAFPLMSNLMLVLISTERYIAVLHPLSASRLCTRQRALLASSFVAFIIIVVMLWRWIFITFGYYTHVLLLFTVFYSLRAIIPAFVLLFINSKIALTMMTIKKKRRAIAANEAKENEIAKMMIYIVLVFLLTHTPFFLRFAHVLYNNNLLTHYQYVFCINISYNCSLINSATTFIFYYIYSTRYRTAVKRLLSGKKLTERRKSNGSRMSSSYGGSRRSSRRRETLTLFTTQL